MEHHFGKYLFSTTHFLNVIVEARLICPHTQQRTMNVCKRFDRMLFEEDKLDQPHRCGKINKGEKSPYTILCIHTIYNNERQRERESHGDGESQSAKPPLAAVVVVFFCCCSAHLYMLHALYTYIRTSIYKTAFCNNNNNGNKNTALAA